MAVDVKFKTFSKNIALAMYNFSAKTIKVLAVKGEKCARKQFHEFLNFKCANSSEETIYRQYNRQHQFVQNSYVIVNLKDFKFNSREMYKT